jgi:hypothetical protein
VVGRHLAAIAWRGLDRSWARVVLLLAATATVAALAHPPPVPEPWLPGPAARGLLAAVLAGSALALVLAARQASPAGAAAALAGSVAAVSLVLSALFLPAFSRAQPGAALVAAVSREKAGRPDLVVAACSDPARVRRDLLLHARVTLVSRCNLTERAASPVPHLLLASPEEAARLRGIPGCREIGSWRYLPAAITPAWLLRGPRPAELILVANFPPTPDAPGRGVPGPP